MKVFAIEPTNHCNAKCSFCPYPTPQHTRQRGFMSWETLARIIALMTEPRRINLSGLGEPTLHPDLPGMVKRLTDSGVAVQLNTNGKKLNQELYDKLFSSGLERVVLTSDYFPWTKGKLTVSADCPVTFYTISREPDFPELGQVRKPLDDWAGQVGKVEREKVTCSFLHQDFVQITWDGTVQRCCCDFNANHRLGSIWDDEFLSDYYAGVFTDREIPLCSSCKGYVFADGIVSGDYAGSGEPVPDAFVPLTDLK
jgi:organic radical activating enzyme